MTGAMDQSQWFQSELLPALKSSESFGLGQFQVLQCDVTTQSAGGDHFTSTTLFVKIIIQFPDHPPETHQLVVKVAPKGDDERKYFQTEVMFHNEMIMYTQTITNIETFLASVNGVSPQKFDLFPKCYLADCDPGKEVVVIQDLRPEGFRLSEERVVLDYDHCFVVMEAIGRFHAISYGMKALAGSSFTSLIKPFRKFVYDDDEFFKITLNRSVQFLETTGGLDNASLNRFKNIIKEPLKELDRLLDPKEPLAVLCHGDFCRNNVLFKYKNGKPCDVKFFDFQTVRYASPAIDLTFFCFLNTTSDFRAKHWSTLFQVYHDSLTQSLASITGRPLEEVQNEYSLDIFLKEFRDYAFYGFFLCNFFLPEMMEEPENQIKHEEMSSKSVVELAEAYVKLGGEKATSVVADIVKDIAKMGGI